MQLVVALCTQLVLRRAAWLAVVLEEDVKVLGPVLLNPPLQTLNVYVLLLELSVGDDERRELLGTASVHCLFAVCTSHFGYCN